MKTKLVPLLGIAFVVALIATGVFYGLIAGKLRSASSASGVTVVVAGHTLARGAVIQAEDLRLASRPELPKGGFSSTDRVIGLAVLEPIGENDPVVEDHVATHKSIPAGMRAISIHVADSSGVVAMLRPGYRVDLQVVAQDKTTTALRTLLQNIEVLSVASLDPNRPVVNLLVTPDQADVVGLADSSAKIRLLLRNPADNAAADQQTVVGETLIHPAKGAAR